jgi:hypothetical protein
VRPEGFSMKNFKDPVGIEPVTLSVCRTTTQPTAPPRAISLFFFNFIGSVITVTLFIMKLTNLWETKLGS